MKEKVRVDAKTGGVWADGHKRYRDVTALRRAVTRRPNP